MKIIHVNLNMCKRIHTFQNFLYHVHSYNVGQPLLYRIESQLLSMTFKTFHNLTPNCLPNFNPWLFCCQFLRILSKINTFF